MNILDIVFPKVCVGCRREGEYICEPCQKKLVRPEAICPMCCKPSLDGWTHPRCRRWDGMERLVVGLPYRGGVQQCLKKVKYKSAWEIIGFLYKLCARVSSPALAELHPDFTITAVPMWKAKERIRGFNQAEIVSELVAKSLQGESLKVLERVRETRPMFGLKKKERRENMEGAFRINPKSQILQFSNHRVILIDDVWTTGATMRECARTLKDAGVKEVWGMTLAR